MLLLLLLATPADVRHAEGLKQSYAIEGEQLLVDGKPVAVPHKPVAVFADEDLHYVVVTADGGLHHHESGALDSLWGLPTLPFTRAPLALPFPVEELRPGRVAYSQRHQNVLFYEDPDGRQFHWGNAGTTTLWVLSSDGRQLLLGDPWLPPDFSRELCAPKRGALHMASVAAAASTVMVIGVDGAVYTRFIDYDSFGGTPFYGYSYEPIDDEKIPGSDPASELQTRRLPAEEWRAQPPLPSSRTSRLITIRQTGQGNAARKLTVVGEDRDGKRGVFDKLLLDEAWTFTPQDVAVKDEEWLAAGADAEEAAPAIAMSGWLSGQKKEKKAFASTADFWFHCSPFHLSVALPSGDVNVTVHTVDSWTLFQSENPRDHDTAMKMLKATLIAASAKEEEQLRSVFGPGVGEPFAFVVVANQHELRLSPVAYPWSVDRRELVLRADPRERARDVVALHPASQIAARLPCAEAKVAVQEEKKKAQRELAFASALAAALPAATGAIDVVTVVTGTRFFLDVLTWLQGLELHLPAVLAAQQRAKAVYWESSQADFDAVERRLGECP